MSILPEVEDKILQNNMEHENDKRVREAEELAKYHEEEKYKAIREK